MSQVSGIFSRRGLVALLAAVVFSAACSDDPTGPSQHEHPAGMRAELDGTTIVSVNAARQVTGAFSLPAGTETGHIHIHFLDEDGDELNVAGYWLRITVGDETIAVTEQHSPGEFEFHISGLRVASTTVVLDLMHGSHPNGHSDYKTPALAVNVVP